MWLAVSVIFNDYVHSNLGDVLFVNHIGLFTLSFGLFGLSQFMLKCCNSVSEESKGTLV
jgi:hypothetical protein